jgi:hypothetical protein
MTPLSAWGLMDPFYSPSSRNLVETLVLQLNRDEPTKSMAGPQQMLLHVGSMHIHTARDTVASLNLIRSISYQVQ